LSWLLILDSFFFLNDSYYLAPCFASPESFGLFQLGAGNTYMKRIKNKKGNLPILALILFTLLLFNTARAQEPAFSYTQYMDNLTPLNPAYSLIDKAASVNTLATKQLIGINGSPVTFLLNGNVPMENINGAAGLIVLDDQIAIEQQLEVNAYFAKAIQLGLNDYLAVSLNAGFRNYIANYSQVSPIDPEFKSDIRETKPNIGFGVMYYADNYYLGVSLPELTITSLGTASVQNNTNFTNHYYFSGAYLATLAEDFKFKAATLVSYSSGTPLAADFSGILYLKEILGIGFDYRTSNQVAGIITINAGGFHIGYSYQFNVGSNDLGGLSLPTNEVTLGYRFGRGSANPKLL
jgi:type IX secretion system PorP/SprF family membrane protein